MADDPKIPPELIKRLMAASKDEFHALVEEYPVLMPVLRQMMEQLEPAAAAVHAFINAGTWAESKRIVEARSELLLSEAAEREFDDLFEIVKDDPDAVRELIEHRELLTRCRQEGIEAAFADKGPRQPSVKAITIGLIAILLSYFGAVAWGTIWLGRNAGWGWAIGAAIFAGILFWVGWHALYRWGESALDSEPVEEIEAASDGHSQAQATQSDHDPGSAEPPLSIELMRRVQAARSEDELQDLLEEHPELLLVPQQLVEQMMAQTDPVVAAVEAFINAGTWVKRKRIVKARRKLLLSEAVDPVFADMLEQYKDDPDMVHELIECRKFLARCRREGIKAALRAING